MRRIYIFLTVIMISMASCLESDNGLSFAEQAEKNAKAGEDFLAENANKDGIVVLDSGLQYKIIKAGEGEKPDPRDRVECHYEGKLLNGTIFDSSIQRGKTATFAVNGVILGWQEALPLMKVGAKWQLFIPSNLAYGYYGSRPSIGPNETLIFDVELIDIEK